MMHTSNVTDSPKALLIKKIHQVKTELLHVGPSDKKIQQEKLVQLNLLKEEYKKTTGEDYKHTFSLSSNGLNFITKKRTSSEEIEADNTSSVAPKI